jgi:hypothetical protein
MKRDVTIAAALVIVGALVLTAQAPPSPGAEHKKLGAFLGAWSVDGEVKPSQGLRPMYGYVCPKYVIHREV